MSRFYGEPLGMSTVEGSNRPTGRVRYSPRRAMFEARTSRCSTSPARQLQHIPDQHCPPPSSPTTSTRSTNSSSAAAAPSFVASSTRRGATAPSAWAIPTACVLDRGRRGQRLSKPLTSPKRANCRRSVSHHSPNRSHERGLGGRTVNPNWLSPVYASRCSVCHVRPFAGSRASRVGLSSPASFRAYRAAPSYCSGTHDFRESGCWSQDKRSA